MLHVNDDMDELFKKAADDYQMNTDGGDFDNVLAKMKAAGLKNAPNKKHNNGRRLLFLLLLIPIGWIGYKIYTPGSIQQDAAVIPGAPLQNSTDNNKASGSQSVGKQVEDDVAQKTDNKLANENDVAALENHEADLGSNKTKATKKSSINTRVKSIVTSKQSRENLNVIRSKTGNIRPAENPLTQSINAGEIVADNKSQIQTLPETKPTETANKTSDESIGVQASEKSNNEALKIQTQSPEKKEESKSTARLYTGIIGGADVSSIKYQSINKVGFNAGVVIGYQFNKKFSAEAQVTLAEKKYYTSAKHFDNSKVRLPYFVAVRTIEGACKMFEVALNGKYNFKGSDKGNWFAIAGVSSFFMNEEDYSYKYVSTTTYYRNFSYKNKSKHLAAVVNVGPGYQHQIANKLNLRIESYIKIPLNGVGIGSLPISSSGVNLGVIKKL